MGKTGLFLVGAAGYISMAVIAGSLALKKGIAKRTGMVTALDAFEGLGLLEPDELVIGGWEIRDFSLRESAMNFLKSMGMPEQELFRQIEEDLAGIEKNIFPGTAAGCGRAIESLASSQCLKDVHLKLQIEKLRADINAFKKDNGLDEAIVCNVASTEPPIEKSPAHDTLESLERAIESDSRQAVRASTLYSYASIAEGCPYINFTPSNAALLPALIEFSIKKRVPVAGNDGKTGETLIKSALAPVFLYRNLEVMSWEGFNILGNMDGMVLDNSENKESKIITKDRTINSVLGYNPHSKVHIHYVPSLDDQKTAWNFIHFKGFLGAKMSLQFIWQGFDSLLAAPLVLDLARLMEFSKRQGESGVMRHLASFFKAPIGVEEQRLFEQMSMLASYIESASIKMQWDSKSAQTRS